MIDTDTIGLCQIMQETLFNETVGSIIFCVEGNIKLSTMFPDIFTRAISLEIMTSSMC